MNERPSAVTFWQAVGTRFLPFADAASVELPLGRLLRLALFQVSVGLAAVLLNGTLNRVLIVELDTPTWIVALMIAIPLLVAPFRALIGYRSDTHRSVLGWRRVPYIWFGTLGQFGGLAIMPFALILVTRPDTFVVGVAAPCLSFLLTGAGMHVTQTAGLALATDIAPDDKRPRVVALLYVMLLVGMMLAAFTVGMSGAYTPTRPVHRDASPPHRAMSGRHRPSESTKPCNIIDIHFPDGERTHQPSIPLPIQQPPPPPGPSPSSPARDISSSAPPSPSPAPPSAPRLRAPTSNPTTSPSSSRADRASPWTSSASSRTRARG